MKEMEMLISLRIRMLKRELEAVSQNQRSELVKAAADYCYGVADLAVALGVSGAEDFYRKARAEIDTLW